MIEQEFSWTDVRDPSSGRLLFRYDAARNLVESVCKYWDEHTKRRVRFIVVTDLTRYMISGAVAGLVQPPTIPASPELALLVPV